jgi:serine/threonine protein kinase
LIDRDGHPRIADFGLLTIISDHANFVSSISRLEGGTTRWMSPELLDPEIFELEDSRPTKESDIYALGMVVYEVLSGQAPFPQCKDAVVIRKVMVGKRPGRPQGEQGTWFKDGLWDMLTLCWKHSREDRPSLKALLQCLERVARPSRPPSPTHLIHLEDIQRLVDQIRKHCSKISRPIAQVNPLPLPSPWMPINWSTPRSERVFASYGSVRQSYQSPLRSFPRSAAV